MVNTLILPHKIVSQSPHCSGNSVKDDNSKKWGREPLSIMGLSGRKGPLHIFWQ